MNILEANWNRVQEKILNAAHKVGRQASEVTTVAVTKYVSADMMNELVKVGAKHIGENQIQSAQAKRDAVSQGLCWHMIGHLQSNKVKLAVQMFDWIHSVHSARLLQQIDRAAKEQDRFIKVLLQVNVSGETSKEGCLPEDLEEILAMGVVCEHVSVEGLMTMAPRVDDAEDVRPYFARLRALADQNGLLHCSMGMSQDFEVAVQEGATMVRVGSVLYEGVL